MHQQSQSINLNIQMENAIQPNNKNIFFIDKLKFRNTIYSPGDDIVLLGEDKIKQLYGKIMLIAKVPEIQFPVLLVSWYFNFNDPIIIERDYSHLSKKELIFSDYSDWQYVESVKGKINIVSKREYQRMDSYRRTDPTKFYCRSYLLPSSPNLLNQLPQRVCHCRALYNPDDYLVACTLCGLLFHPRCSQADELCIMCRY